MRNGTSQKVHNSTITHLAQSNAGNFVLTSAVGDYNVCLSSLNDEGETQPITVLLSIPIETVFHINDIIFDNTNEGDFFCCYQCTVQHWDLEHKAMLQGMNSADPVNCISGKENIIYAGCSKSINVFDIRMQNRNAALILPIDNKAGEITYLSSESNRYNLIAGTSRGFVNCYDFRNEKMLQIDMGYILGEDSLSVDQISINQNKFDTSQDPGLFIMTNEPECTRIIQLDVETAGREVVNEYRRMSTENHERYKTEFVTVGTDHDILIGSGSDDGRILLLSGKSGLLKREYVTSNKTDSKKKSVINHISYRRDFDKGVFADSYGYIHRFDFGMLSDASI